MGKRAAAPIKPARTVEQREAQMINLALELAEKQLRDGSAPATTVNHYLKLASTREALEVEKLRHETALLEAKKTALVSAEEAEKKYKEAIEAFRTYSGAGSVTDIH